MTTPHQLTIRAYQVGFGDCFLLTFHYQSGGDRHILIDFGSTAPPRWSTRTKNFKMSQHMVAVAQSIKEESGGKLHAVVATHRHKDHISGFSTRKDGEGSGDIIRALEPDLVIQPWTEDPDAAPDATVPTQVSASGKAFIGALGNMHRVSKSLLSEIHRMYPELRAGGSAEVTGGRPISREAATRLSFMGENNITNRSAVENLMTMGKKNLYVHYGSESKLEEVLKELLPGVKVRVLGPPTLEQSDTIRKQRSRDQNEFWHLQARANSFAVRSRKESDEGLFPGVSTLRGDEVPRAHRWLTDRMQRLRGRQLLEIVRILDKAMNNTSVILLFDAGKQRLLFPGDAQIENWSYALKGPGKVEDAALLKQVTFYKVGHHGSLNATPKTLWNGFALRSPQEGNTSRLQTIVSTRGGKHGSANRSTEVPRRTLIEALEKESSFFTTEKLSKKQGLFKSLTMEL